MKKTLKTQEILGLFNVLSNAKYGKMEDADKIKVWKITRALKPVAEKFDEDTKDAAEKMKPTEDFDERLSKAQQYDRAQQQQKPTDDIMRMEDYENFIKDFKEYQKLINDAVKDFAEKEVEIDFEPLNEESFGKLMASNEWDMKQTMTVGDIIVA